MRARAIVHLSRAQRSALSAARRDELVDMRIVASRARIEEHEPPVHPVVLARVPTIGLLRLDHECTRGALTYTPVQPAQ